MSGVVIPLINNAALLLALAVVYGAAGFPARRDRPVGIQLWSGALLGGLGVFVMVNALELRPGLVVDTRSVVLGLSGLFFGLVPTALAASMTAAYRLWLGGPGVVMGVGVVASSASIGYAWRRIRGPRPESLGLLELYLFGVVVHLGMLAWIPILPDPAQATFLTSAAIPVMVVYPAATALLAWVIRSWHERARAEEAARELTETREHLGALLEAAPLAVIGLDLDDRVTAWNRGAERIFQWRREEVLGRRNPLVPDGQWEEYRDMTRRTLRGEPLQGVELTRQRKDGERVRIRVHNAVLRGADGEPRGYVGIVEDMTESEEARRLLQLQESRQEAAARLGRLALGGVSLDDLFEAATDTLVEVLEAERAGLFELRPDATLELRAGTGWPEGTRPSPDVGPDSIEGRALRSLEEVAVVTSSGPVPGQADPGSGICVKTGGEEDPFGVLGVYSQGPRAFSQEEADFVLSIATLLGLEIERQQTERARREAYERLLLAQKVGSIGFLDWDLRTNEIEWSEEVYRLFGVPVGEPQTLESTVSLLHPEDAERVGKQLEAATRGDGPYNVVHRMVRPDGQVVWVRAQGELELDEDGEPYRFLGTVVDVTPLMRTQEELRTSEARYRRLFHHALSADYISTPDGWLIDCNPTFVRLFGFESREEALSTPIAALYDDPGRRERFVDRLRRDGSIEPTETVYLRQDGTRLHVIESAVADLDEDGEVREIIGFIVDISERTTLESQLRHAQKMEALGRLAGGVAHDFNNNLAVILGHAELVREELAPDHPIQAELTIIEQAGERSADLTRQLLAFSRRQSVAPAVMDLNQVVRNATNMLKRLVGEDIRFEFRPAEEELWKVRIDPAQIEQILVNLVLNARDAIQGGGRILVETANEVITADGSGSVESDEATPGDYAVLSVSDTGHGMDARTVERIFEPFFTTKAAGLGTGLGLSTVYGIVRQNGGWIDVETEPGGGSTFRVHLARFGPTGEERARPAAEPIGDLMGQETVLVAEDEPAVLALVQKILERHGYTVLAAPTPQEAIGLARSHPGDIHLLLSDVVMPQMNGPQLKERIEEIRPEIRTLFASGYTDDVVFHSGVLDEQEAFIQKPFAVQSLASKVRSVLDG